MYTINIKYTYALFALIFIQGCSDGVAKISHKVPLAPNNAQVIVTEENYGATTPYVYKVYICAEGVFSDDNCGKELLLVDKIDLKDLTLDWNGEKLIVSVPDTARVYHFSNFWYSSVDVKSTPITIELQSKLLTKSHNRLQPTKFAPYILPNCSSNDLAKFGFVSQTLILQFWWLAKLKL